MRAIGNGEPMTCLQNLLSMVETECPLARDKGIDARLVDRPADNMEDIDEDITDLIAEYEPRLSTEEINIVMDNEGDFSMTVQVGAGGEEDGI
ncbi:hypothetical protein LI177_05240 [bacterium 210820-DFI.6.37]|nr:hypothetical protein [bacterium 210820-DFI.6.37]